MFIFPVAQASLKSISMTSSSQQRKLIARTCKQGSSLQLFPPAEAAAHNNVPVEAFFPQTTSAKVSVSERKIKSPSWVPRISSTYNSNCF